jgi:four helix bundle protein
MNYTEWKETVPETIREDSLWKTKVYRLALFAGDLGWRDVTRSMQDRRTRALSDQLYRALGSISANVAEGYSRGTGRDRARFYEYALGSARESRDWYCKCRDVLHQEVARHRLGLLTQIIRLLLTMIPQQRGRTLREERSPYQATSSADELNNLLEYVPLPQPEPYVLRFTF